MLAAVYYSPGDIRLEERPEPEAKAANLIVQVAYCAICGTDVKLATIGHPRCHPPRIIGHEMVGRIVHVGSKLKSFAVGERITLATTVACGECFYCSLGKGNLCPNSKPISFDFDGAFADYLEIPSEAIAGGNVIKVPEAVADTAAALSEPLSCAINSQELACIKEGDKVLILGGGPLSCLHAELAKANGAEDVMIMGSSEPRLSLMRRLKDVFIIDGRSADAESAVRERSKGQGVDQVIVCTPLPAHHEQSLRLVRKGGTVSFFASLPKGSSAVTLDSRAIHYGEIRIVGASDSRPEHVARAVELLADGKIDTTAIITHLLPLSEFNAAIELMKKRQSLKVLLHPKGEQAT